MTCQSIPSKRYRRGNSLIFMLLAIVISGVAVAIGVQYYIEAERTDATQRTITEIVTLIGNARGTFGIYNFSGLNTSTAISTGLIPESRVSIENGTEVPRNIFGGSINILGFGDGIARLGYGGVPSSTCQQIIHGTHRLARAVRVGYAMHNVKPLDGSVDIQAVNTYCSSEATVPIYWIFGKN